MASFNGPKLTNPIRTDVPDTQEVLAALVKQDPTSISDIPVGAKRMYEASNGKWQWQEYNGSSWVVVPFLQHNVDQLDGYHAAIAPAANTVAVRNASGLLQDSITGNAATASSAATLSQTLPVNKGGTGATTSEAARSNLGVPPTSHASTATTYGVATASQYGHLKLSDATNSSSGVTGGVAATPAAVKAAKETADAAQSSADAAMTKASTLATSSAPGIVKPGTGMSVDSTGSLGVNDTVVRTSENQEISGQKFNTTQIGWPILQNRVERGNSETTSAGGTYCTYDKNKRYIGAIDFLANKGDITASMYALNGMDAEDSTRASITVYFKKDGTKYATCPTPPSTSNTNTIATTEWVRDYAPLASATKAGLVKIGEGLNVESDGTLTANSFPTPDWAARQARSFYTSYTATEDGYLFINMCASNYTDGFEVTIGNLRFTMVGKENYGWTTDTVCLPIKKGTTYSTSKVNDYDPGESSMYFIPVAN